MTTHSVNPPLTCKMVLISYSGLEPNRHDVTYLPLRSSSTRSARQGQILGGHVSEPSVCPNVQS